MVLKIRDIRGWTFIERVFQASVQTTSPPEYSRDWPHGKTWGNVHLTGCELLGGQLAPVNARNDSEEERGYGVVEIRLTLSANETWDCLIDTQAYLMSDEGKTIERIN